MTKAEDLSKQYKDFREQCGIKDPVMLNEIEEAYFEGYLQAEKDLELTLEDVKKILALVTDIFNERNMYYPVSPEEQEEFYHEVLKRFKEYKRQQANSCKI